MYSDKLEEKGSTGLIEPSTRVILIFDDIVDLTHAHVMCSSYRASISR
jgi:hypothetical protein